MYQPTRCTITNDPFICDPWMNFFLHGSICVNYYSCDKDENMSIFFVILLSGIVTLHLTPLNEKKKKKKK
jgi:hypothetical protein